jgi:tight adherence protein C
MNGILYVIGIMCLFLSLYTVIIFAVSLLTERRWKITLRLQRIKSSDSSDLDELEPLNLPFRQRVLQPALQKLGKFIESLAPIEIRRSLSEKLVAAGYTSKSSVSNFLIVQGFLIVFFTSFFILLAGLSSPEVSKLILFGFLGLLVSILLPIVILNSKKINRQNQIRRELPDMLDLLVVSVEAGLGFDMALVKVTEKLNGPLSRELTGAMSEIRMGKVRRIALREMAERTGVDELISFVSAVFQADQLGVGIGNVLRVQSESMRNYRRQKIEEAASKAPIKILFPLIFCILPSLFVIIMGPAVIHLIKIFAGMG